MVAMDIQWEWKSSFHTPEQLVELGYMEEVKENKEILDIDKKLSEQFIKDNVACQPCEMWKPNSILEKLREQVELKLKYINPNNEHSRGEIEAYAQVLTVLTYLDTKEQREIAEKVHKEETALWMYKTFVEPVLPQFTPWQEIDHDQVKENIRVMDEQDWYSEVIVPKFDYEALCDSSYEKQPFDADEQDRLIVEWIWEQIEKITQWIHSQSNK